MRIELHIANRKPLVQVISEITGQPSKYMRTPTYTYQIGEFTVTREGDIEFDDKVDAIQLLRALVERGYSVNIPEDNQVDEAAVENEEKKSIAAAYEPAESVEYNPGLVVTIPKETMTEKATDNVIEILLSKDTLIRHALGIKNLNIVNHDGDLEFRWFEDKELDSDEIHAYTTFISKLCEMGRQLKRVNSSEREVTNEKYAFRCFLMRLGFIGNEYKMDRKILLRSLDGSSAFKQVREAEENEISN